jgi:NAD+ synthase (glutamine-hydrolysing)
MRIAMAQLYVKAGRSEDNLTRMHEMVFDAKKQGADLIIFPEMSVPGYILADKWLQTSFRYHLGKHHRRSVP